jgi:hypothetical protein
MYLVRATYEDGTECSDTSAYKIQTPEYHPNERIQYSKHGESWKSRVSDFYIDANLPTTAYAED